MEYQFTNSANWSLFWQESRQAVDHEIDHLNQFYPIPRITVGVTLESPVIAIHALSNSETYGRKNAGRIFAKIGTGITVNAGTPDTVVKVGKFYLDQIEIIRFPDYSSNYSLEIDIPYWIRQISITIWEYTGNDAGTVHDKLDRILTSVTP